MFYRRTLPHLQRDNKCHFITYCTRDRWSLPNLARDIALSCILQDNGPDINLDAAVVMPDHVHLILTPLMLRKNKEFGSYRKSWMPSREPQLTSSTESCPAEDRFGRKSHSTMCFGVRNKIETKFNTFWIIPLEKD